MDLESGVPRFVTLGLYVPKVNQELPDWPVLEGDMEQVKGHQKHKTILL